MKTAAEFSDDRRFRYRLDRVWDETTRNRLVVIGLNPSTADESVDDPTIRRCIYFAQREAMGGLIMVNLFSLRSTDPVMLKYAAPELSYNDISIMAALHPSESGRGKCVAAWGCHGDLRGRDKEVLSLLHKYRVPLYVFGLTKDGFPKHPLYLRKDTPLVEWDYAAQTQS